MPYPRFLAGLALAVSCSAAFADKTALSDDELATVSGHGVAIAVHLVLNGGVLTGQPTDSRITAGFDVGGVTTYVIAQNLAGVLDLFSVTLAPKQDPDSGINYLSIGMPDYVSAKEFGVRALAVQTDATGPITSSLGSILLNGSATMTGQLNLWPR